MTLATTIPAIIAALLAAAILTAVVVVACKFHSKKTPGVAEPELLAGEPETSRCTGKQQEGEDRGTIGTDLPTEK